MCYANGQEVSVSLKDWLDIFKAGLPRIYIGSIPLSNTVRASFVREGVKYLESQEKSSHVGVERVFSFRLHDIYSKWM